MNEKFFELPDEKKANILNGAIKTFARMGYRKASTGDIAGESGISKSLLFHYFGTKAELFNYLFNYAVDTITESMASFRYKENEDLFDMIYRANVIKLGIFKKHPYLYRFVYQAYFEDMPEVLAVVRVKNNRLLLDITPDVLKHMDSSKLIDALAPEKALQIILWVSEGFLQSKLMANDIDPDTLFDDFEDLMKTLKLCFYK